MKERIAQFYNALDSQLEKVRRYGNHTSNVDGVCTCLSRWK